MARAVGYRSRYQVVSGALSDEDVKAAAEANRKAPERERLLDALVRAAVGASKAIRRRQPWSAVAAVQEMRVVLLSLRGERDTLSLDPADPAEALAKVLAEARSCFDLGPVRIALLERTLHYRARMTAAVMTPEVTIVPANEASWEDLQAVLGSRGDPHRCQCQRFKMRPRESWASTGSEELAFRLREQTDCGHPESGTTSGLVAYLDGEPVGWCAVEPRTAYPRLLRSNRVPWVGRTEDKTDDSVWAVTCFVTRTGFRRRGISRALAHAAVDFAREGGARAVEGYPMTRKDVLLGELHVGTQGIFAAAGFTEVSRPTLRRVVMRIDF